MKARVMSDNFLGNSPRKTRGGTRFLAGLIAGVIVVPGTLAWPTLTAQPADADQWRESQSWITEYGFDRAWETTRGEGVTVAVIDTGVDGEHPDLAGNVVGGTDLSGSGPSDGTGPMPFDPDHGTMVASLLGGHGNNLEKIEEIEEANASLEAEQAERDERGEESDSDEQDAPESPSALPTPREVPDPGAGEGGIIGTAPEVDILTVSIDLSEDVSAENVEQQIADAVRWSVDSGADVINISLASASQDWPVSWDEAFAYAEDQDVVVVAAAGNRASGSMLVGAPATIPGVLTVAGVDESGSASWESSTEGITVAVSAQSDPLVGATHGGGYITWAGTSGAAPIVSGLVALVRSAHPELDAANVINRIVQTAQDAGDSGYDPLYGYGIIDAEAAVNATGIAPVEANPLGSIHEWIRVHRRGSVSDSESNESGQRRENTQAISYPTELPGAELSAEDQADYLAHPEKSWQPLLVLGGAGIVSILVLIGVIRWFRLKNSSDQVTLKN